MIEEPRMTDITSKKLIVLKGTLFLLIVISSSMVILIKQPTLMAVLALCVLIWASARFAAWGEHLNFRSDRGAVICRGPIQVGRDVGGDGFESASGAAPRSSSWARAKRGGYEWL